MAAGAFAGRSQSLDTERRRYVFSSQAVNSGIDRMEQALYLAAVHLGRNIDVRLRLFGFHADAVPPPRLLAAPRFGAASGLARNASGGSRGITAGRFSVLRRVD